jgi:hypothetical protein
MWVGERGRNKDEPRGEFTASHLSGLNSGLAPDGSTVQTGLCNKDHCIATVGLTTQMRCNSAPSERVNALTFTLTFTLETFWINFTARGLLAQCTQ